MFLLVDWRFRRGRARIEDADKAGVNLASVVRFADDRHLVPILNISDGNGPVHLADHGALIDHDRLLVAALILCCDRGTSDTDNSADCSVLIYRHRPPDHPSAHHAGKS